MEAEKAKRIRRIEGQKQLSNVLMTDLTQSMKEMNADAEENIKRRVNQGEQKMLQEQKEIETIRLIRAIRKLVRATEEGRDYEIDKSLDDWIENDGAMDEFYLAEVYKKVAEDNHEYSSKYSVKALKAKLDNIGKETEETTQEITKMRGEIIKETAHMTESAASHEKHLEELNTIHDTKKKQLMVNKGKNISKRDRVVMMIAKKEQRLIEIGEKEAKLKARGMTLKPRTEPKPAGSPEPDVLPRIAEPGMNYSQVVQATKETTLRSVNTQ